MGYITNCIVVVVFSLVCLYGYIIGRRLFAWLAAPEVQVPSSEVAQITISVIVPVRNEATAIQFLLQDLAVQTYPSALFEILIVDDYSEDTTAATVLRFSSNASFKLQYVALKNYSDSTGKKAAVQAGVSQARGELLVLTDGDCRVQPGWLQHLAYVYRQKNAKFISGPVCYQHPTSLFEKMQLVEFAALIGVGAGSLLLKQPNMCNGANIAYPKAIFNEVHGYTGNEHIPSGDDEFLMHKVFKLYPESVIFLKSPAAVVYTQAKTSLPEFFSQRVRWASKWPAYTQLHSKLLAVLVFIVNAGILGCLGLFSIDLIPGKVFTLLFFIKFLIDILFLIPILRFFKKTSYWLYIIPLQFIYIPYVVITALFSLKGSYNWKGRNLKTEQL